MFYEVKQNFSMYYRVCMFVICFIIFFCGALFLGFVLFPFHKIISTSDVLAKKNRASIKKLFIFFCFLMKFLRLIEIEVEKIDKINKLDAAIIVANHPTLLDYIILTAHINDCLCIVKKGIWNNSILKNIVRPAGYMPNNMNSELILKCDNAIEGGSSILIFPQGTRSSLDGQQPIKSERGASQLALRTKTNLLVISIALDIDFLNKSHKWYMPTKQKPKFKIKYEETIHINKFLNNDYPISIQARKLNKLINDKLLR